MAIKSLGNNWYEGKFDGHFWQAKVYPLPSQHGIDEGRVSKLAICKGNEWNPAECIYNFDRGLDYDNCPPDVLAAVLAACEQVPA